jgi:hypothetical protein
VVRVGRAPGCLPHFGFLSQGEYGTEMYFLAKGIVEVTVNKLSDTDLELLQAAVAGPQCSFGGSPLAPAASHESKAQEPTTLPQYSSVAESVSVDPVTIAVFTDGSFFGEVRCSVDSV